MNRLDGKVALLSGAARGIGAETARLMVEAGARVAIADVLDERGRETAQVIGGSGDAAFYLHLDVTQEEAWMAAVAAVVARFGKLDIASTTPVCSLARTLRWRALPNGSASATST